MIKKLSKVAMVLTVMVGCKKEVIKERVSSLSSVSSSNAEADSLPKFGVLISSGSDNEKMTLFDKFGVLYTRTSIFLKNFNGRVGSTKTFMKSGYKVLLNLNWGDPSKSAVPFPTDSVSYVQRLTAVLNNVQPEVAVIENEPTTPKFHTGKIEDYIRELRWAVNVCHSKGVKVADGAIHVPIVLQVMKGGKLRGKVLDVSKLIKAYATMDLDYVNIHLAGDGDSYNSESIKTVGDYVRSQTGHQVMSNEFNVHSPSTSLIDDIVKGFKEGQYEYVIARSGKSDGGSVTLQNGTTLLPNGVEYANDIK